MKKNLISLHISSLNQTRLIEEIKNCDISLFNIELIDKMNMQISVSIKDIKKIKNLLNSKKINFNIVSSSGVFIKSAMALNSIGLLASVVLCLCFAIFLNFFYIKVDIIGCEDLLSNKISNVLTQNGIDGFVAKSQVEASNIENLILTNFNEVSYCSVIFKGQTIIISIKEKLQNNEYVNKDSFEPIVSEFDGYVVYTKLVQGTLLVKVGDLVKKGDAIIAPYVVLDSGDKLAVQAMGEIRANVYFSSSQIVAEREVKKVKTGEYYTQSQLMLCGLKIYNLSSSNKTFDDYITETFQTALCNNLILPFIIETKKVYELKEIEVIINFDEVKDEILKNVLEKACKLVPDNAIIKNENNIVVIEGGLMRVSYTYECEVAIC